MTPGGFFSTTGNWTCEDPSSDSWKEPEFQDEPDNRGLAGATHFRGWRCGHGQSRKRVLIASLRLSALRLQASLESGEGWIHTFRASEVDLKLTEGNLGLWEQWGCGTAALLQL